MGLSIFYSGTLGNANHLPVLIDEITDVCDALHWPWQYYMPSEQYPLEGMTFNPPGAQLIFMTFLKDGRLAEPYNLYSFKNNRFEVPDLKEEIIINPIIQYAGPEAHMQLISIMRHLSSKYFSKFKLIDESEFWETGNEQKCRDWFAMFSVWMDNMSDDLGKLDGRGYEGGQTYHSRLLDYLHSGGSPMKLLKVMGSPFRKRE
ncbi:MAG TPA: hypothetical protein VFV79_03975 [Saprospiraceae bacterium]|nr:hypothetical protein [Saprospiraceae bacterium]